MKNSSEPFKELNDEFRLTEKAKSSLRNRILTAQPKIQSKRPYWITAVITIIIVLFSPLYSTTMADVANKILPLEIKNTNGEHKLIDQLDELFKKNGYKNVIIGESFVNNYTISIGLSNVSNKEIKKIQSKMIPPIKKLLTEQEIDEYHLDFYSNEVSKNDRNIKRYDEMDSIYDQVLTFTTAIFKKYGYSGEKYDTLAGLQKNWFSYTIDLEMPDDIPKSTQNKIINDLAEATKAQDIKLKEIKVHHFNIRKREIEAIMMEIADDLGEAVKGKSYINMKTTTHMARKEHGYAYIDTKFTAPPSKKIQQELKDAISTYLKRSSVQKELNGIDYTVGIRLANGDSFISFTNK